MLYRLRVLDNDLGLGRLSDVFSIQYAGEHLELLPSKAIFWRGTRTLILADTHFGKASAFRHGGPPVPEATTQATLDRLNQELKKTDAARLLILGDFFHARTGRSTETMEALAHWRQSWMHLEMVLIAGNHDCRAGAPPAEWKIDCRPHALEEGPFYFTHDPAARSGAFTLAGHLHPSIYLRDSNGSGKTAPCFCFGPDLALLPAFGDFTGTCRIQPRQGDRVFAVVDDQVLEIKNRK